MTAPRSIRIKRGDPIRARYLNGQADQIDELRRRLARVERANGVQAVDSNAAESNLSPAQLADPLIASADVLRGLDTGRAFAEIARVSSVVRVFNPEDDAQYVDVERVDLITFETIDGERMTLIFDN